MMTATIKRRILYSMFFILSVGLVLLWQYPNLVALQEGRGRTPYPERIIVVVTNPSPIVIVSDASPDPYTHPTTHPAAQFEELGLDLEMGHGDGGTTVGFVGKAVYVTDDGRIHPVPDVKFFRLNDSMLLREARRDFLPFTTDTNGNFHAMVNVFAAFGCRKGSSRGDGDTPDNTNRPVQVGPEEKCEHFRKKVEKTIQEGEWVIYQTGTALIGLEADGFEPRCVNVRYQQPSTMIVMNRRQ